MASGTDEIRSIVEQVLRSPDVAALLGGSRPGSAGSAAEAGPGVFPDVGSAVSAAAAARQELAALPLDARRRLIDAVRRAVVDVYQQCRDTDFETLDATQFERLADALRRLELLREAGVALDRGVARFPDARRLRFYLAETFGGLGRYDDAESQYKILLGTRR